MLPGKVTILILLILLLFHHPEVFTQDNKITPDKLVRYKLKLPEYLILGIESGTNFSHPWITSIPENTYGFKPVTKFKSGWQIALKGEISTLGNYILFTNIQYLKTTSYSVYNTGSYRDEFTEKLQFISIPVGIRYKLGSGMLKYLPLIGLSVSYLINSNLDFIYHPLPDIPGYRLKGNVDLLFDRNRLYLGALTGTGFRYQVHNYYVTLEILYYLNLRNFINTKEMRIISIYSGNNPPFSYQSSGFKMHGLFINFSIQILHK